MGKKAITILLCLISVLSSVAKEKILMDDTENGVRTVATDFTDSKKLFYAVSAQKHNGDTNIYWTIVLRMVMYDYPIDGIDKDAPFLLRLGNDEVVELKCKEKVSDNIGSPTLIGFCYKIYPSYIISKTVLDKIAKFGIKKARIQFISDVDKKNMISEWEFTKQKDIDKVAAKFSEKITLVESTITKSNDIRDDF